MKTLYRSEIEIAAAKHGLGPDLVESVVVVESAGITSAYRFEPGFWRRYMKNHPLYRDKNPLRVAASYGLLQTMFVVAVECGYALPDPEHLFVPSISLEFGCTKLRQLLDWSDGVIPQALAAYNGGKGANSMPPYRNQSYVDKVLKELNRG